MYDKVARHTAAVWGHRETLRRLDGDTDDCKRPTRPVKADSIVVKMLWTVLCSSHDGVPLNEKRIMANQNWYHFRPLVAVVGQYL